MVDAVNVAERALGEGDAILVWNRLFRSWVSGKSQRDRLTERRSQSGQELRPSLLALVAGSDGVGRHGLAA